MTAASAQRTQPFQMSTASQETTDVMAPRTSNTILRRRCGVRVSRPCAGSVFVIGFVIPRRGAIHVLVREWMT